MHNAHMYLPDNISDKDTLRPTKNLKSNGVQKTDNEPSRLNTTLPQAKTGSFQTDKGLKGYGALLGRRRGY